MQFIVCFYQVLHTTSLISGGSKTTDYAHCSLHLRYISLDMLWVLNANRVIKRNCILITRINCENFTSKLWPFHHVTTNDEYLLLHTKTTIIVRHALSLKCCTFFRLGHFSGNIVIESYATICIEWPCFHIKYMWYSMVNQKYEIDIVREELIIVLNIINKWRSRSKK